MLIKNNRLLIFPKQGAWVKPFYKVDEKTNSQLYWDKGISGIEADSSKRSKNAQFSIGLYNTELVQGNVYNTTGYLLSGVITKDYPFEFNLKTVSLIPYIIFGDLGTLKRYMYRKGRISWIPN